MQTPQSEDPTARPTPADAEQAPRPAPPSPTTPPAHSVADGRERQLDPASVTVERLQRAIGAVILAALAAVAVTTLNVVGPLGIGGRLGLLGPLLSGAVWLLLLIALAGHAWFWPPVRYRHTSYRISDQGIRIRRGVVWRVAISVPRSRVQHTDVAQGPVERAFGLATLVVYTAGTQHASVPLSGLKRETALDIRDHLIDSDDDDAV
jgi:membrane protein YdbS with pleckstrin-like domain